MEDSIGIALSWKPEDQMSPIERLDHLKAVNQEIADLLLDIGRRLDSTA